jgi:DNA polymerase-3 subunit gamma/tau
VIFVLATTELDKVPETILSRCQVFSFRKPTEKILTAQVEDLAKREKVNIDTEAAALIGFLGDGSFRDTYGLLQKVLSASPDRSITRELVEKVTGAPSLKVIYELYDALINKDIASAYAVLNKSNEHHTDMMLLAELLLDTMRMSLMYRYAPAMREQIESEHNEQYIEIIKKGAVEGGEVISSGSIISMITAVERIAYAAIPVLPLELAFLEMTGAELKS